MAKDTRKKGGSGRSTAPGGRALAVRVKTAKGRKLSSKLWLERQLNDPYVREAQRQGYRSRAAFKLIDLDDRFRLLAPGRRVVDLGAAPGGWTQVAVARVKPDGTAGGKPGGRVVALDISAMAAVPGATVLHLDFLDPAAPDALKAALGGPADVVLSDMAPPVTGHNATDHLRIMTLVEAAFAFAEEVLAPGGAFIAKVFQGGTENTLLAAIKRRFAKVRHAKPPASRAGSSEIYLVATEFHRRND